MKPIREYLDILFRRIQPEMLITNLRASEFEQTSQYHLKLNSQEIAPNSFRHYSHLNLRDYSPDEVNNFYYDMETYMKDKDSELKKSIFNIIPKYMSDIITMQGDIPCCKYLEMLNWRTASLCLGQDLLLMSYLAYEDHRHKWRRTFFAWNSIIGTDNVRLHHILEKGMAENHYHLYGSTQIFSLSWGCMMNHPAKIWEFFSLEKAGKRMMENLNENITLGVTDNQLDWVQRLYIACWIRKSLFQCCKKCSSAVSLKRDLLRFIDFPVIGDLEDDINVLRFSYGKMFEQYGKKSAACLDYAIEKKGNDWNGFEYNRFLTGERKFLYDCFSRCYSGEFTKEQQDAFYLYLLIKAQFRSELIQVNQRTGFHNFSEYQDRKGDFWEDVKEYSYESYRLAIQAPLQGEKMIESLEVRITPKQEETKNRKSVAEVDQSYYWMESVSGKQQKKAAFGDCGEGYKEFGIKSNYFFVIHFIKFKSERYQINGDGFIEHPRNHEVRKNAERGAKSIRKLLIADEYYAERVWGIDAASAEIGCRPEAFATEFRFLRTLRAEDRGDFFGNRFKERQLSITYHAGEDFLDIADGLRAINEAVWFLEMKRGDRIGHAIALGVDPRVHYSLKHKLMSIPKQDLLDNYVWLLYRSLELGVSMAKDLRSRMQYEAQKLLYYIFPDDDEKSDRVSVSLRDYYESWKLRGDHPDLYKTGKFCKKEDIWYDRYERKKECGMKDLEVIREQKKIAKLYYRYHFDHEAKTKGQEIENVAVTDEYITLMEDMQKGMKEKVLQRGIGIECNPSSNVLIGTFKRYDRHPILQFNNYTLKNEGGVNSSIQMNVSINTDDQGVFDTSLENEYALMACALEKVTDESGKKIYSQDAIYDYLDHVRQMGLDQVFRQKGE